MHRRSKGLFGECLIHLTVSLLAHSPKTPHPLPANATECHRMCLYLKSTFLPDKCSSVTINQTVHLMLHSAIFVASFDLQLPILARSRLQRKKHLFNRHTASSSSISRFKLLTSVSSSSAISLAINYGKKG